LYVNPSWLFIAVLYVWVVYDGLSREASVRDSEALVLSLLAAVLFFGGVLVHELAHAATARALDLPVAGITLVFWGGATETKASARGPLGEFLVAAVGPASTLVLAGVFWMIDRATVGVASDLVGYLAFLSLVFAIVNALPGFPLDGGRMLLAVVWGITGNRRTAMRVTGYGGVAVGAALAAAAVWSIARDNGWWIFLAYLAVVLIATGRGMDRRVAVREELGPGRASDAMRPPPPTIPASTSLGHALDLHLRDAPDQAFPVVENGRVIGTVSRRSARRVGARDPMRPVRDGTEPLSRTPVVSPDEPLDEVLEWLSGRDGLVIRDGSLVGAIGPGEVERWYRRVVEGRSAEVGIPPRPDL
jgi:Zn-dependent protease